MFITQGINNGRSGERNGFSLTPKKYRPSGPAHPFPVFFFFLAFLGCDLSSPTFLSGVRIGRWLQKWRGNGSVWWSINIQIWQKSFFTMSCLTTGQKVRLHDYPPFFFNGNRNVALHAFSQLIFTAHKNSCNASEEEVKLLFFFRHTQALPSIYGVFPPPLISLPPPYFLCPLSVKIGSKLIMGLFCGLEIFFILLRGNSRVGSSFFDPPHRTQ